MEHAIRNRGWTGGRLNMGYRMAGFAIALLGMALFVFLSPWGVGAQAGADVSAQVPAQILAERLVDVAVDVDNLGSDDLKSAQVIVTYDPALLAPQQITPGDLFDTDCFEENSIDPAIGQISLFFDCDNAQSGSPLNLWNIEFFAGPVTSPTNTDLFVGNVFLFDENFQVIASNRPGCPRRCCCRRGLFPRIREGDSDLLRRPDPTARRIGRCCYRSSSRPGRLDRRIARRCDRCVQISS